MRLLLCRPWQALAKHDAAAGRRASDRGRNRFRCSATPRRRVARGSAPFPIRMVISSSSVAMPRSAAARTAPSRCANGGSSSVAGRYALRAAPRGCGSNCHLSASRLPLGTPSDPPQSCPAAAQRTPARLQELRGMPHTAPRRFVLGDDRAAARDHARRAFDTIAAHAGQHDASAPVLNTAPPRRTSGRAKACSR